VALYWYSEGYGIKDIAYEMGCGESVVQYFLQECRGYLGASNNDEMVVNALIRGLLIKRRDLNNGIDYE